MRYYLLAVLTVAFTVWQMFPAELAELLGR